MKRLARAAVLVSLVDELIKSKSWSSETHLQKSTYLLQEMLGVPLELDFILYKHGPFSFDLKYEIAAMLADDFIELQPKYPFGPSIIPGKGIEFLKRKFPKTIAKYNDKVLFVVEKLGAKKVVELERLATAFYVTNEMTANDLKAKASQINKLKPHISIDEAITSIEEIESIIKEAEQQSLM